MINNIKELKFLLEDKIKECNRVIILPHKGADCDAIAGALAINLIVRKFNKVPYILLDDINELEHAVKGIIESLPNTVNIITPNILNKFDKLNTLLITVDTNKIDLLPINDFYNYQDIIVIDHHNIGEDTIKTDNIFIDINVSSVCEIMYKLLECFQIKYDEEDCYNFNIANYLLAGISLDTTKFTKRTTSTTMRIVADLMRKGADLDYVNNLFLDDFEKDCLFMDLVRSTSWKMFNIAIAINNNNPNYIYDKEDLAKAADWLNRYKQSDASFAIGLIEKNLTYISGRSKGIIDIGEIMSRFGGGGNKDSGAAKIETNDVKQIKLKLENIIKPGYQLNENE